MLVLQSDHFWYVPSDHLISIMSAGLENHFFFINHLFCHKSFFISHMQAEHLFFFSTLSSVFFVSTSFVLKGSFNLSRKDAGSAVE